MVRQLFAESLIEKHGDPIKHVSRGSLIEGGKSSMLVPKGNVDEQNRKRKAEDQVIFELNPGSDLTNLIKTHIKYCKL